MFIEETEIEFYEFGNFRLDPTSRHLSQEGKKVLLPSKVFDILLLLIRNRSRILTKELIINNIWSEQFVEENNLTVRMSALRKSLGEKRGENLYIETVPGSGYRFVAKVRIARNQRTESEDNEVFRSLAILPFINESNKSELDYLSDGLTEIIINNLSQLSHAKIIARTTVFRYRGQEYDPQVIGRELEVRAILIGRIYEIGSEIIVSVEIVDTGDNSQIWGARYSCPLGDLFNLQEEITKEVSAKLKVKLTAGNKERLYKRYTQNSEAYLLYLKGRYYWNKRSVPEIRTAIQYFQQAIEKDSNYALAYTGLADCYRVLCSFGVLSPQESLPKAEEVVLKALEMDDSLAEAHISLASIRSYYNWDFSEAEKEFKRGTELDPKYAPGHYYFAVFLSVMGRFDEALFEINQALQIDPLSFVIRRMAAKILYFARQNDEAIRIIKEGIEIDNNFGLASGILGIIYLEKKMYEEALREFQKLLEFSAGGVELPVGEDSQSLLYSQKKLFTSESDPEAISLMGYIYGIIGKRKESAELLKALEYQSEIRYVEPHTRAIIYMGLGNKAQAFEWLYKSYADKSPSVIHLKVSPLYDSLRADPRFDDLLKRIGFTT